MSFDIQKYWRFRFDGAQKITSMDKIPGWDYRYDKIPGFVEPDINFNPDSTCSANECKILFVSAPGAVGKSTLSKQICFETNAIYVDLSICEPVAGNFLSGGILRANLVDEWRQGKVAFILDGLDEARMKVNRESFEAFINDLVQVSKKQNFPIAVFGRTGAVNEARDILNNINNSYSIIEIGYFSEQKALELILNKIKYKGKKGSHISVQEDVAKQIMESIRSSTSQDGDKFSGYAPVLDAIAEGILEYNNAIKAKELLEEGNRIDTLLSICNFILDREQSKVKIININNQDHEILLYNKEEQMKYMFYRRYKSEKPSLPHFLSNEDKVIYEKALESWVDEHPFMQSNTELPSSSIFDAIIAANALLCGDEKISQSAVNMCLRSGRNANPFLFEFYTEIFSMKKIKLVKPEHIPVLYLSFRAGLTLDEKASILISTNEIDFEKNDIEEEDLEKALEMNVEIIYRKNNIDQEISYEYKSTQEGKMHFGEYLEDVEIEAPLLDLQIGSGSEMVLVSPVNIKTSKIEINASKLIIQQNADNKELGIVYIEANSCDCDLVTHVPVLRSGVKFEVVWPGCKKYPWTDFATDRVPLDDPRMSEALRRFRKLITSFRSHSKGALARFKDKIEHNRMTKGLGKVILDKNLEKGIVSLSIKDRMYYLDANLLGSIFKTTYADCVSHRFSKETIDLLRKSLFG